MIAFVGVATMAGCSGEPPSSTSSGDAGTGGTGTGGTGVATSTGGTDTGGTSTGGTGTGGTSTGTGGAAPVCGNGDAEDAEACDGADLKGQTCASLGFQGGTLACTAGCELSTSLCHDCGDGNLDPGETCDGAQLNGASCASLGFDLGVLSCSSACDYDTAGCKLAACGDGAKNGAEECDGADLGGASCASLGFVQGTLTCSPACSLDPSQCLDACDVDEPPSVTLPVSLTLEADTPFSLHAIIADDDPIGDLTIQWSGSPGAPPLAGASTPDPTGTTADCGAFSYTVTVTDPCGEVATATVSVTVPAAGPHVSSSTCTPNLQCGSVQHPWCTIQAGVAASASDVVMVAGAPAPYAEAISLGGTVQILGGYEPTFTQPRNPDPATNQTTVQAQYFAFSLDFLTTATIDGFNIVPVMPASAGTERALFSVAGNAHATIANVVIHPSVGAPKFNTEYGIRVANQSGGTLVVQNSTIRSATPSFKSAAVGVLASTSASVTIMGSSLLAVDPGISSGVSVGLEQLGTGVVSITGGTVKGAQSEDTYGLFAPPTATPASREISLNGVDVQAGVGKYAHGIRVDGGALLSVTGGSVLGKGSSASTAIAHGLRVDSVSSVALDGVTVVGTDAVVGNSETVSAHGVRISNTQNVAGAAATIVGSNIVGGSVGLVRAGIASAGVPIEIETSTVAGSKTPVVYGSLKGPYNVAGIDLTGTFPAGTVIHIHDNVELVGGDVRSPCFDSTCGSAAIRIGALVDSIIEHNTLVRGAWAWSGFSTDAIRINQAGTHQISQNDTIEAGIQGGVGAGIRVVSVGPSTVTDVFVEDNTLIAGTITSGSSDTPVGFYGEGVNATITGNARIVGGYGPYPYGIRIERSRATPAGPYSNVVNVVNIQGNFIDGGTNGANGVRSVYASGSIRENVIQACGIWDNGQPAPGCKVTNTSVGLHVEADNGTLVANNYVFGGYTSRTRACRLGCFIQNGCDYRNAVTFVHNTCAATQVNYPNTSMSTYALQLANPAAADCPVVANNILDAQGAASNVHAFYHFDPMAGVPPTECYHFENNDMVPRNLSCLAYVQFLGQVCFPSAAQLDAKGNAVQQVANNVDLDPLYVAEDIMSPDAAGYHLDPASPLNGLGLPLPPVTTDFDGDARDPSFPTPGADEVP